MGQYIGFGIATKITVKKANSRTWHLSTKDELLEKLKKNIDLKIFDVTEDDDYLFLEIKHELFEKNIVQFISEQLHKIDEKNYHDDLEELKELNGKSYEELLRKVHKGYFQFLEGNKFTNDVSYLINDGSDCYADIIMYFCEGKAILECYSDLFTYIRNLIIKSSDNPLKEAAIVTMVF